MKQQFFCSTPPLCSSRRYPGAVPSVFTSCLRSLAVSGLSALRGATLAAALAAMLCILAAAPRPGLARAAGVCSDDTVLLYAPAAKGSQLDGLYKLAANWIGASGMAVALKYVSAKGGSDAIARIIEPGSPDCAVAGLQFPTLYLQSGSRHSLFLPKDLHMVCVFASSPSVLWIAQSNPARTLPEFLKAQHEARAQTGQPTRIAGAGSHTDQHAATLLLARAAGLACNYLPMLSSVESVRAVREGMAQACWGYALPASTMPGLKPIAVAAQTRARTMPETATFAEHDLPVFGTAYFGLGIASKLTVIVAAQSLADYLTSAATQEHVRALGFEPVAVSFDELPAFLQKQQTLARDIIREYPLIPPHLRR